MASAGNALVFSTTAPTGSTTKYVRFTYSNGTVRYVKQTGSNVTVRADDAKNVTEYLLCNGADIRFVGVSNIAAVKTNKDGTGKIKFG